MVTVALWSFAVFLASVFAGILSGITLEPKYNGMVRLRYGVLQRWLVMLLHLSVTG